MSDDAWVRACARSELLPGETRVIWADELPVLLVNLDGEIYALEDRCSHEDFELSSGELNAADATIECTLHGAKFDVRDGSALCAPAYEPVRKFAVKIADGDVWVNAA